MRLWTRGGVLLGGISSVARMETRGWGTGNGEEILEMGMQPSNPEGADVSSGWELVGTFGQNNQLWGLGPGRRVGWGRVSS